jgi:hypothetical protein
VRRKGGEVGRVIRDSGGRMGSATEDSKLPRTPSSRSERSPRRVHTQHSPRSLWPKAFSKHFLSGDARRRSCTAAQSVRRTRLDSLLISCRDGRSCDATQPLRSRARDAAPITGTELARLHQRIFTSFQDTLPRRAPETERAIDTGRRKNGREMAILPLLDAGSAAARGRAPARPRTFETTCRQRLRGHLRSIPTVVI